MSFTYEWNCLKSKLYSIPFVAVWQEAFDAWHKTGDDAYHNIYTLHIRRHLLVCHPHRNQRPLPLPLARPNHLTSPHLTPPSHMERCAAAGERIGKVNVRHVPFRLADVDSDYRLLREYAIHTGCVCLNRGGLLNIATLIHRYSQMIFVMRAKEITQKLHMVDMVGMDGLAFRGQSHSSSRLMLWVRCTSNTRLRKNVLA